MKRVFFSFVTAAAILQGAGAQSMADSIQQIELHAVEINAMRVDKNTPVAFHDLSSKDIERKNYGQDFPALLSLTPSMQTTSDAGNGIGYSDIRLRGTDGTRINVTMNGVLLNDAEMHKLYWVDSPDLMSSVGSIQIQRGVGSSVNGAGAFGGSINMTTSNIPAQAGGQVSFSYGSYGTRKESIKYATGLLNDCWAFEGRFSHVYSDGYIDRAWSDLHSYMFQMAYYEGSTVMKYILYGGNEQTYNAWDGLTMAQMRQSPTYNPSGQIEDENGTVVGFYKRQTDNFRQSNHQLILKHKWPEHWHIDLTGHYTRGDGFYDQWKNNQKLSKYHLALYDETGNPLNRSNLTRRRFANSDFAGFVGNLQYWNEDIRVQIGSAANYYVGEHFGQVTGIQQLSTYHTPSEYYRNYSRKSDVNLFVKANWKIFDVLNLYGDLQYRHIRHQIYGKNSSWSDAVGDYPELSINKAYHFLNPKFGLNYRQGAHNAYASFGIAQKEPNRDHFTNAEIDQMPRPEYMQDWEVGYHFENKLLQAGINLYWMQYKDQLVATGGINPNTYDLLYFNVPNSFRRGVELSASLHLLPSLSIGGHATFSQNRILNYTESIYSYDTWNNIYRYLGNTEIALSPDILATAMLRFQQNGWDVEWNIQHVGEQYLNNSQNESLKLSDYQVSNVNIAYGWTPEKYLRSIRFGLAINNLFNEKYCSNGYIYDSGTSEAEGDWFEIRYFPQATRNVLANITIQF